MYTCHLPKSSWNNRAYLRTIGTENRGARVAIARKVWGQAPTDLLSRYSTIASETIFWPNSQVFHYSDCRFTARQQHVSQAKCKCHVSCHSSVPKFWSLHSTRHKRRKVLMIGGAPMMVRG